MYVGRQSLKALAAEMPATSFDAKWHPFGQSMPQIYLNVQLRCHRCRPGKQKSCSGCGPSMFPSSLAPDGLETWLSPDHIIYI